MRKMLIVLFFAIVPGTTLAADDPNTSKSPTDWMDWCYATYTKKGCRDIIKHGELKKKYEESARELAKLRAKLLEECTGEQCKALEDIKL